MKFPPIYSAHLAADGTYYVLDPNGNLLSTYATADEAIDALRSLYDNGLRTSWKVR